VPSLLLSGDPPVDSKSCSDPICCSSWTICQFWLYPTIVVSICDWSKFTPVNVNPDVAPPWLDTNMKFKNESSLVEQTLSTENYPFSKCLMSLTFTLYLWVCPPMLRTFRKEVRPPEPSWVYEFGGFKSMKVMR
jgi:hypothetical protein